MVRSGASLINSKPPRPATPFAVGSLVVLRACPAAPPGVVQGQHRKRVIVRWNDLNYVGRLPSELRDVFEGELAKIPRG